MPMHSKNKKKPRVGIKLRAGGDPHMSEKPGWSAGDMRQWPKQQQKKNCVGIQFLPREFCFLTSHKSAKWLLRHVQGQQNDYFNYDLFKDRKMIMTCSKSAKWLVDLGLRSVGLNNYLDVCLYKFKISRPK